MADETLNGVLRNVINEVSRRARRFAFASIVKPY